MTAVSDGPVGVSSGSIARARRKAARRRFYRAFVAQRAGVAGVAVLLVIAALALLAPVLFSSDGLDVTKATGGVLQSPSGSFPLGTDENGRSVLALVVWGCASR